MNDSLPKCYKCGSLSIEVTNVQKVDHRGEHHKCLACKAEKFYPEHH